MAVGAQNADKLYKEGKKLYDECMCIVAMCMA